MGRTTRDPKEPGKSKANAKTASVEQEHQGFVYKYKGFTIGNRERFRRIFSHGSGTLYGWYTGEIYVIDDKVVPNAERDDFEASAAKVALEAAVFARLRDLAKQANTVRERARADEIINNWKEKLPKIEYNLKTQRVGELDLLEDILDSIQELERQKAKASPERKEELTSMLSKAKELKKSLQSEVGRTERKHKQSKPSSPASPVPTPVVLPKSDPQPKPITTLVDVLQEYGLEIDEEISWLIQTIDSAIIEALGVTSSAYQSIINEIDRRCQEELAS